MIFCLPQRSRKYSVNNEYEHHGLLRCYEENTENMSEPVSMIKITQLISHKTLHDSSLMPTSTDKSNLHGYDRIM